jgi:hypothetical protein
MAAGFPSSNSGHDERAAGATPAAPVTDDQGHPARRSIDERFILVRVVHVIAVLLWIGCDMPFLPDDLDAASKPGSSRHPRAPAPRSCDVSRARTGSAASPAP